MPFRSRVFQLAKDPDHPHEYQDSCRTDGARSVAVIADGVSSSIFSAQWADLLTAAVLACPPDPDRPESFAPWLQELRKQWSQSIDTSSLAWFQRAKLPQGAFSTLLWLEVSPVENASAGFGAERVLARAIGDSCLFHLRGGELVRTFPMQQSAEFQADPIVLGSVDLKRDHLLGFGRMDEFCYPDDLLVLCTDALAEWAMRRYEENDPPDWDACWDVSDDDWAAEIVELRSRREMRIDDTTLALLRVVPQEVPTKPAAKTPPPRRAAQPAVEAPVAEEPLAEALPAAESDSGSALDFLDTETVRKVKSVSEQVAKQIDQTSEEVLRTVQNLGKKAWEKYRDKFRPKGK
jgi:hypothetical protein